MVVAGVTAPKSVPGFWHDVNESVEIAIKNRIPKIVFIHGVGERILKAELDFILNRYENISSKFHQPKPLSKPSYLKINANKPISY